ncbi:hypothetical protein K435DRAFT_861878 [Dendrothele bispora CBS 962.96]|uniref:Uncharacterized protein n=1 Tax=Dendrothele bispora (strain CBS 962.96) TaxID=1314807 RepID=A0A4S8LTZ7_DENBC|nr:hypothetical protein K435DRAFT_861878 [Dendrothele bispora CBS 962.96]
MIGPEESTAEQFGSSTAKVHEEQPAKKKRVLKPEVVIVRKGNEKYVPPAKRKVSFVPEESESSSDEEEDQKSGTPTGQTSSGKNTSSTKDKDPSVFKKSVDEEIAERIYRGSVVLDVAELISVSPAVRRSVLRRARNCKIQPKEMQAMIQVEGIDGTHEESTVLEYFELEELAQPGLEVLMEPRGDLPEGAIVQRDVVEQFRQDRPPADREKRIIVAARRGEDLRWFSNSIYGY